MSAGKHLKKGSPRPALPDDGIPRLYSMRFCPFAQRAHLALNAKKLPYHTIFINLTEKPEWLVDYSPLLKVPALHLVGEKGQPALIESLIIVEYLDEKYPENPLLPKDPLQRAQDRILVERFGAVTSANMKVILQDADPDDLWSAYDIFEKELANRGTPFFSGEKPGFVDYMIWPWFERLPISKDILGERYIFETPRYAKLNDWKNRMVKDELVQSYTVTPEKHVEYFRGRRANATNYDLLAE